MQPVAPPAHQKKKETCRARGTDYCSAGWGSEISKFPETLGRSLYHLVGNSPPLSAPPPPAPTSVPSYPPPFHIPHRSPASPRRHPPIPPPGPPLPAVDACPGASERTEDPSAATSGFRLKE
ncbi:hypothetical protein VPH35_061098 [Triticum aestivum]